MRILLLEYLTGRGLAPEQPSTSLMAEGLLMRDALLADLADIPGVTVAIMQDARLPCAMQAVTPDTEYLPIASAADFERIWRAQLALCDAVWPIAPETGGILTRLCRDAEHASCTLLTASSAAVALAGDKLGTVAALMRQGVPTAPTRAVDPGEPPAFPCVVKPVDGAGCEGLRVLRDTTAWQTWLEQTDWRGHILQPLLAGEARSLSALFANGRAGLISDNGQQLRHNDGRIELAACAVNLVDSDWTAAERLAMAVAAALPELWGYAGIDYLQTEAGPVVLEVNPRLTTSYVGIRAALGVNVAALVLDLWRTGRLPPRMGRRGHTVVVAIAHRDAA